MMYRKYTNSISISGVVGALAAGALLALPVIVSAQHHTSSSDLQRITPPFSPQLPVASSLGAAVATDGDTMAVAAPGAYFDGHWGGVMVYRRSASSWQHLATLVTSDAVRSVAISGDNVVVGAYQGTRFSDHKDGVALVFHDTSVAGDWSSYSEIDLIAPEVGHDPDVHVLASTGEGVAIDGTTIVVGVPSRLRCSFPPSQYPEGSSVTIFQGRRRGHCSSPQCYGIIKA
jgi:hypothetical protein